ncbi:MAG: redoxin domain-containing protein [Balneolaceae bacterium]
MKLKVGDPAPGFTLQNTNGEKVSLEQFMNEGAGNTLLLFFPLAFSGVCTDELCKVRDNMKFYEALDATVAAISIDSFFTLKEFKRANNLKFPLLSDFNKEASEAYGVLYDDYFGMKGVSKRAAFVIDNDGIVKYGEVLEDSGKLPDFNAIQKTLNHSG